MYKNILILVYIIVVFFSNYAGLFGTRFLPTHPTSEDTLDISKNYRELSEFGNWFQLNFSFLRFTMIFTVTVHVSVKTGTAGTVVPIWPN